MNPKTKPLFFLFVIASIAEIALISRGNETLRIITKPLIIPILAGIYHLNAIPSTRKNYKDPVLLGLFFSWIGDILLQHDEFFIPGLISLSHSPYFLYFLFLHHAISQHLIFQIKACYAHCCHCIFDRAYAPFVATLGRNENTGFNIRYNN